MAAGPNDNAESCRAIAPGRKARAAPLRANAAQPRGRVTTAVMFLSPHPYSRPRKLSSRPGRDAVKLLLALASLGLAVACPTAAAQPPKDAPRDKPEVLAARADDPARLKELWNQAHKLAKEGKPKEAIAVCE